MLLATGPNGKCHRTAEIKKKKSTPKRNLPFYSAEQISWVTATYISVRFLKGLAIALDVESQLPVKLSANYKKASNYLTSQISNDVQKMSVLRFGVFER